MNDMKETWIKGLVRAGWAGVLGAVFCLSGRFIAPLYGEDSAAATGQYSVAVAFQNQKVYDLAIERWSNFIKTYPTDSRVNKARHYLGVCYFSQAVSDLEAKPQTEAAQKCKPRRP